MTAKEQGLLGMVDEMLSAYDSVPCTWGRIHDHAEITAARQDLAALASDTGERGVSADRVEAALNARLPEGSRPLGYYLLEGYGREHFHEIDRAAVPRQVRRLMDAALRAQPAGGGSVELEAGVKVPMWLLDYAQKVELYMKANLPGPWRIGGIQSYDYKKEIGHE